MEASALPAPAAVARTRTSIGAPLLRLRSDEQLVALFRAGHEDAFRIIHDRYRQRLFAYTRQMLPHRQDAEDALQDIFVRAYSGLRANHRELALRAWLYRVAHNRCIDELRRPSPPPPEVMELLRAPASDPIAEADQRESLRRLIADVRRLPEQQRSALLMRELGGMSYADMASALGVTIPAVKSLLVRARLALGQAIAARDTACSEIRDELIAVPRPRGAAERHGAPAHARLRGLPRLPPPICAASAGGSRRSSRPSGRSACSPTRSAWVAPGVARPAARSPPERAAPRAQDRRSSGWAR